METCCALKLCWLPVHTSRLDGTSEAIRGITCACRGVHGGQEVALASLLHGHIAPSFAIGRSCPARAGDHGERDSML